MDDDGISRVSGRLENLESSHNALEARVGAMERTLDTTAEELEKFRSDFQEFQRLSGLRHNVELAQLQLVSLRQDIEKRFGYRDEIRMMANGILEAMDAECITNESIQGLAEEKMLTAPGYWLAPTLVGLAAWIRDDPTLADRAMRTALERDAEKASLFYGLILVRLGRQRAAAEWLQQTIAPRNLRELPREFAVVLDAAVGRALGRHAQSFAVEHMKSWFEELADDRAKWQQQVSQWRQFVVSMNTRPPDNFRLLKEVSPNWTDKLLPAYERSLAFATAKAFFCEIHDRSSRAPSDLREQIRNILRNLVYKFDGDELAHSREEQGLQAVIDAGGDEEAARSSLTSMTANDGYTVDFLTLITRTATTTRPEGDAVVSAGTQWITILLSRQWIVPAVGALAEETKQALPEKIDVSIRGWQGQIGADISPEQLVASARKAIDTEISARVAQVHFGAKGVALAAGACLGLGAAVFYAAQGWFGLPVLVLAMLGIFCTLGALYRWGKLGPARNALHLEEERRVREVQEKIPQACDEFREWREECRHGIAQAAEICSFLGAFPDVKLQSEARAGSAGDPDPDFNFPGPPLEWMRQLPVEDSSGKRLAIRLPSWNLLPPHDRVDT